MAEAPTCPRGPELTWHPGREPNAPAAPPDTDQPGSGHNDEVVTVPVTAPPAWCLCGHGDDEHGTNGRCRATVNGRPCGCRDFEEE